MLFNKLALTLLSIAAVVAALPIANDEVKRGCQGFPEGE